MTNTAVIADRPTRERLSSYLAASGGDLDHALELYEWNSLLSGALHEDIGRVEVVLRNALDQALTAYHRDLNRDHAGMLDVVRWICTDTSDWAASTSRSMSVLSPRP